MAEFAALLQSDPALLRCQLRRLDHAADLCAAPGRVLGIGYFEGGRVLLRKRPVVRPDALEGFAGEVRSEMLVAACRGAAPGGFREEDSEPFRFRHWVFAGAGRIVPPDGRAAVLASLPDFLRRGLVGRSDAELAFLTALSDLHAQTRSLDNVDQDPETAARALASTLARLDAGAKAAGGTVPQTAGLLSNGRMMAAVRRGRPLFYALLEGLPECPVCGIDRDTPETDPRVRPHRRLKAVALTTRTRPEGGVAWIDVPEGHLVTVSRSLHVRLTPL